MAAFTNTSILTSPLNWRGQHPYVPHVTGQQLASNRCGYVPCLDQRPATPGPDRRYTVLLPGRGYMGRPVMRVQPIISIPDSTSTHSAPTVNESGREATDVDVETIDEVTRRHQRKDGEKDTSIPSVK